MNQQKFLLGQVVMTRGVADWVEDEQEYGFRGLRVEQCLLKHQSGDWGLVDDEDKVTNDNAVKNGDRILSAYEIDGTRFWIITEWDRSVTTVLFPSEY